MAEITLRSHLIVGGHENALTVLRALRDAGVLGSRAHFFGETEVVMIVVDDPGPALAALGNAGFHCDKAVSVVAVPMTGPHAKERVMGSLICAKIQILHQYVLRTGKGEDYLVLRTTDSDRAVEVITCGRKT